MPDGCHRGVEELASAARMYREAGYVERGAFGGYPDNGVSLFLEKRWKTD